MNDEKEIVQFLENDKKVVEMPENLSNEERKKYFNDHKGKLFKDNNGKIYKIIGAEFKDKITNRYLLYDISHTEQFFKQIRGLYYYMAFAKQINYTLVLPKMRYIDKDDNNNIIDNRLNKYVSFENYFNIDELKSYHKVITIEEFEKLDIPIDYLYFENTEFFTKNNELYTQKDISLLDDNKVLFSDIALQYKNFIHKDMNKGDFTSMFINSVVAFKGVFFQPNSGIEPFDLINKLNFRYKYHEYVIKLLQNQNIEKYIAVHYRQTDFLEKRKNRNDVLKDVDYVIETCKKFMKIHDISNVYISTDSKDENILTKLKNELPLFFIQEYDNELTNEVNVHIIESCICINSNVFIGTNSSCYSSFIYAKRICNNKENPLNFNL